MTNTPVVEAAPVHPPTSAVFDPTNYVMVMVHICNTFGLTHPQMMTLRQRVEKTYHAQPMAFSRRGKTPVTLNAVAITYGLAIGYGGFEAALEVSVDQVIRAARTVEPFRELDRTLLRQMQHLSKHDRRGKRFR